MEYRSSNGGMHIGKDFVAGVENSHGVELTGGSTGGVVQPVGDDANISITLRGKGSGGVVIGSTTQTVTIAGGTGFKGFQTSTFTAEFGAISSGQHTIVSLSTAFGSFADGDLVNVYGTVTPAEAVMGGFRIATDASTRLNISVFNPGSTATSTGRVVGRIVWADLT